MTQHIQGVGTGDMQQKVSDTAEQAAGKVREAGATVRGRIEDQVGTRSTQAGEQVGSVGDAMRQAGEQMRSQGNDLPAQLATRGAEQVDRLGRYLRESDGEAILRDVEDFARRQPWIVAGIGLAVGLGVARLLKASGRRTRSGGGETGGNSNDDFRSALPARSTEPVAAEPRDPYAGIAPPPDPVPSAPPPSVASPVPPVEDPWARPEGR